MSTRAAALEYAQRGWPVFPLHGFRALPDGALVCTCGKECASPGKHPRTANGLCDATTDPEVIEAWWDRWPDANVAICTGGDSFCVLDVDGPEGATEVESRGELPPTVVVKTAKGRHFYFKHPGVHVKSRNNVFPQLDSKADGGYVVAPPSRTADGGTYFFETPPEETALAPIPKWWKEAVNGPTPPKPSGPVPHYNLNGAGNNLIPYVRRALESEMGLLSNSPIGDQNTSLNKSAFKMGQLVAAGVLDEDVVRGEIQSVVLSWPNAPGRPPWTPTNMQPTLGSGLRGGKAHPRRLPESATATMSTSRLRRGTEAVAETDDPDPDRPTIEVAGRQLRDVRDEAVMAMCSANDPPVFFHGDAGLTRVVPDKEGAPVLHDVDLPTVQSLMSDAANWIKTLYKKGEPEVHQTTPPRGVCEIYRSLGEWPGVPPIDGVVTAPIVARNRTICATPGYNRASRLWLHLPDGFEMPDTEPTAEAVAAARTLILETLLGEVAFADQASRAHAVALMLLPFVRLLIPGPTPFHLFDAPVQSSGKSFAARICIAPFTTPAETATKGDEEEWRKAIFTNLLYGRSHIFVDNIKGQLASPSLALALTSDRMTERVLGSMTQATVQIRAVWVGTSNNANLDSDTASRTILIRLDTGMETPEERVYKHNPLAYIDDNRGRVVGALLTIVRKWIADGCPEFKGEQQVRQDAWKRVMGGILESAGVPGFLDNWGEVRKTLDSERVAWMSMCGEWWERFKSQKVTAAQLLPLALEISEIASVLGDKTERSQTTKLGQRLRYKRDSILGGYKILPGDPVKGSATYYLLPSGSKATPDPKAAADLSVSDPDKLYAGMFGDEEESR